jgi:hypothetical protein
LRIRTFTLDLAKIAGSILFIIFMINGSVTGALWSLFVMTFEVKLTWRV